MNTANHRVSLILLQALVASVPVAAAAAQESPTGEDVVQLEKVEVTGSRIRRVDVEGPAPVVTITRDQIDKLGYTSVKDILGNLTYNTGGTFDAGQAFSAASGTQSVDLRGFGAGRTLILLDGRRLPVFPQGQGGTDAFVDLSTIPSSLVERVEILLDGASAIHGSDAISGVINIITRKNLDGTEGIARVFGTEHGGGSSQRYQLLHGTSIAGTSVQLVGEYTQQDVLRFTDRGYSDSDFDHGGLPSSFGNTFIGNDGAVVADPHCGTPADALGGRGVPTADGFCGFDRSKFRQWIPEGEKGSLYLRADRKLGRIGAFARLGYFHGSLKNRVESFPYTGGESSAFTSNRIIPDSAFDPTFGPGFVAAGAPNNPTTGTSYEQGGSFFRRLVEFGARGDDFTTRSHNVLVGIGGSVDAFARPYAWEVGLAYNDVRLRERTQTVLSSVFDNEVSNNGLDLFETIPQVILDRTRHKKLEIGNSRNHTLDATLTGPLGWALSGGAVQIAFHVDYGDEKYVDTFDPVTTNGDVLDGGVGGGGDREYVAAGLELSLPIRSNLELGVAGRVDRYQGRSEVGAFSPSVRIGYRPAAPVLLRASWGESFHAPDLQRLFGATTHEFDILVDTPLCVQAGGTPGTPVDAGNPDDPCREIYGVPVKVGANAHLREEQSKNYGFGFVVEPVSDVNLRVDYYHIEVDDLVSQLGPQQLLDLCASSGVFCDAIRRDPATGLLGTPRAGGSNAALVVSRALNLATQKSEGFDAGLSYRIDFPNLGRFDADLSWSHLMHMQVRSLPGGDLVEQIGFGQTVLVPRNRYSATVEWSQWPFGATVRLDRVGRYPGSNGLTQPAERDQFVEPYTTVNIQGRIDFGKAGLVRVGIDNVLDEDFPIDPTFVPGTTSVANQFAGAATSLYASPLGRAGYVQYELKF